jgi:dTDP-4-amino-4,6-dideoxygalactose transaminase
MIPVYKPTIKRKDMDNVLTCMVSEVLGPGAMLKQLLEKVDEYLDTSGVIALSSYYFTLMVAFDALDMKPGDCVIVSALAPNLALRAIRDKQLIPVIIDVNPESGTMNTGEIEKSMEKNPKAIFLHYTLGFYPDVDKILGFNIPIIEDISHCFGAKKGDTPYGCTGNIGIMSLDPENIVTTGTGGIVFTRDKKTARVLKTMHDTLDSDLLLSDFNASLGLAQLKEIDRYVERRREIYSIYRDACIKSGNKTLTIQHDDADPFFSFPVILSSSMNDVRKYARKHDLDTLPAFLDSILAKNIDLEEQYPHAKNLLMRCLLFPLYPMLSNAHVDLIAKVLSTLP